MEENTKNIYFLFVGFTFILYLHITWAFKNTILNEGYLVAAIYNGKTSEKTTNFVYNYSDTSGDFQRAFIRVPYSKFKMMNYSERDSKEIIKSIIYVTEKESYLQKEFVSDYEFEKYKYPVKTINRNVELGNDSYEYAKYERDIAYKYYGLNIVQIAYPTTPNILYVTKLTGDKYYIKQDNNETDLYLAYSNINPDFYDGWHICHDSLCTPENISKVDSAGYGYIFRGKIYSAAETEKYWNIIEQYKLRNH